MLSSYGSRPDRRRSGSTRSCGSLGPAGRTAARPLMLARPPVLRTTLRCRSHCTGAPEAGTARSAGAADVEGRLLFTFASAATGCFTQSMVARAGGMHDCRTRPRHEPRLYTGRSGIWCRRCLHSKTSQMGHGPGYWLESSHSQIALARRPRSFPEALRRVIPTGTRSAQRLVTPSCNRQPESGPGWTTGVRTRWSPPTGKRVSASGPSC